MVIARLKHGLRRFRRVHLLCLVDGFRLTGVALDGGLRSTSLYQSSA